MHCRQNYFVLCLNTNFEHTEIRASKLLSAWHFIQAAETAISEPVQTGSGRILVMDDEEPICEVLEQTLKRLGYEVACARDGAEAIALYQREKDSNHSFDAVLVDLTIPGGMGGKEVAPA
jgi:PleD family two-component response regulator